MKLKIYSANAISILNKHKITKDSCAQQSLKPLKYTEWQAKNNYRKQVDAVMRPIIAKSTS